MDAEWVDNIARELGFDPAEVESITLGTHAIKVVHLPRPDGKFFYSDLDDGVAKNITMIPVTFPDKDA